jgi:hypothetical protein
MKAIEIKSKTDKSGKLNIDYKLNIPNQRVRVLILIEADDDEKEEEKNWLGYVSKSPAFEFLKEAGEDIYSK